MLLSAGQTRNSITKRAASGGEFAFRNNLIYDSNNRPFRSLPTDWTVNFEAGFRQPLLQGAGSQYNRIAGPFDPLVDRSNQKDLVAACRFELPT